MKQLTSLLALTLFSLQAFSADNTASVYTDITKDCIVVSEATDKAPIDFYTAECKAFGGYALKIDGGDLRYGPVLTFNGVEVDLQRPGAFHDLGSDKIEWVYELSQDEEGSGTLQYLALIYRLSVADADPSAQDQSVLYVVRLNQEKSCVIGKVATNEAARDLAKNTSAPCL